jgi:calmodulin
MSNFDVFKAFDKNGDGKLSKAEIKEGCKIIKPSLTEEEIEKLISKYDFTGDGMFDYAEFLKLLESHILMSNYETFKAFDKNGDGKLSKAEIKDACKKIMKSMSDVEIEQLINKYDITGDGMIDYGEFLKMIGQ